MMNRSSVKVFLLYCLINLIALQAITPHYHAEYLHTDNHTEVLHAHGKIHVHLHEHGGLLGFSSEVHSHKFDASDSHTHDFTTSSKSISKINDNWIFDLIVNSERSSNFFGARQQVQFAVNSVFIPSRYRSFRSMRAPPFMILS